MTDLDLIGLHLQHLRAGGTPSSTIQSRREVLRRLDASLPFGIAFAITEQVQAWLAALHERALAHNTLANYQYHARSFYEWASTAGYIPDNPTAGLKRVNNRRGLPRPVTEAELAAVLEIAEPLRTAVVLAAFAGLRRAEITKCRREHITEETITVPSGKGGEPGAVPCHPYVWAHVRDHPPGYLITDRKGRPVTPTWLGQRARYGFDALGLGDVHLHRLRHRYGTVIQQLYGDLRVTQECMRHKSVLSTQGYTLVTGQRRAEAVAALPVPPRPA